MFRDVYLCESKQEMFGIKFNSSINPVKNAFYAI